MFRELEGACTPFLRNPVGWLGTHLPLWMDLLVQEQDLMLTKDLADKRTAWWVQAQWNKETPAAVALTTVSPGPQP